MKIHAWAVQEKKGALGPFEYEPAPLGPHDVEIAISHCGICHSDVHLVDGDWGVGAYPMVPGHEIVGSVVAAGPAVRHLKPGERVGVGWQRSACLTCEVCIRGEENLCRSDEATCVNHHGGFADRIRVDARFAFPIPDALPSEEAAPLLCGGVTVYAPLSRLARSSMRVGIVGVGGLGHLGIQFARAMGCEVTALSSTPEKEDDARRLGAHHFVVTREGEAMAGLAHTLDLVLSTAFIAQDWPRLVSALRPNGTLCLVGVPSEPLTLSAGALLGAQRSVTGSAIGGRPAIRRMLEFAARHGVGAEAQSRPMAEADAALDDVRQGRARYRAVLVT
jgi:uncharacterized zinc-type alcohol dehydrogenase-like protein